MKRINKLFLVRLATTSLWITLLYLELTRHSIIQSSLLIGTILLGPIFCGWFCPMGFIQNTFNKIGKTLKLPKVQLPQQVHKYVKYLKYVLWTIALLPLGFDALNMFGIEPRRTVNGLIVGDSLSSMALISLVAFAIISLFNDRFYCKYLCTKGAEYSIISSLRFLRIKRTLKCVECNKCNKECPMQVDILKNKTVNDITCISCLDCIDACKVKDSIKYTKGLKLPKILKKVN